MRGVSQRILDYLPIIVSSAREISRENVVEDLDLTGVEASRLMHRLEEKLRLKGISEFLLEDAVLLAPAETAVPKPTH